MPLTRTNTLPAKGVKLVVCRATDDYLFCHYSDGTYRVQSIKRKKETLYEPSIESHQYISDALANYDSARLRSERTRTASAAKYSLTTH